MGPGGGYELGFEWYGRFKLGKVGLCEVSRPKGLCRGSGRGGVYGFERGGVGLGGSG